MAGEDMHEKGREGLHRAKQWLDRSTRVAQSWPSSDRALGEFLHFQWPDASGTFSFDLGGKLRGGTLAGRTFVAEIKNYTKELDLATHFRDFQAKSYVAYCAKPDRCDVLMWISWSPFKARSWDEHTTPASVRKAILDPANRYRVLKEEDLDRASAQLNEEAVVEVSRRLWMITLCERQEELVISDEHMGELMKYMQVSGGGTWE
ncbi:hypothetical protein AB0B66_30390 [Catellatospora sp. NPDC049111]|uniref:hypothetical protein n=1 Tax=Catellatospora sp. NPDC049111 TaxID=3155271 RepID=UPI0033C9DF52